MSQNQTDLVEDQGRMLVYTLGFKTASKDGSEK
jgi:hypothetical protein